MAELVYDIDLNVRKALKGIDDLQTGLKKTNKLVKNSGKVFTKFKGILAGVSVIGFGALVKTSLGAADSIGKVANKTGFAISALQELRFAADQSGIAAATLDTSLQRFSRRVGEAAHGTGVLVDDLKKAGIAIKNQDGSMRDINSVFMDYMKAIDGAGSKQEKLRLAIAAFDSEGGNMVNMLGDGIAGLVGMREEAHKLGVVLEDNTIKKATKADDAWGRVRIQFKAIALIASAQLAPAVKEVADRLSALLSNKEVVQELTDAFKSLGDGLISFVNFVTGINWGSIFEISAIAALTFAINTLRKVLFMISKEQTWNVIGGKTSYLSGVFENFGDKVRSLSKSAGWGALIYYLLNLGDAFSHAAFFADLFGVELVDVDKKLRAVEKSHVGFWGVLGNFFTGNSTLLSLQGETMQEYANRAMVAVDAKKKLDAAMSEKETETTTPAPLPKLPKLPDDVTDDMSTHIDKWTDYRDAVRRTTEQYLPLKTATTAYNSNVKQLSYALEQGIITSKEHATAMGNLNTEYAEFAGIIPMVSDELGDQEEKAKTYASAWKDAFTEYKNAAFDAANEAKTIFNSVAKSMEDAIFNFAKTGKMNFKSFAQSVIDDLLRIQSKKLAANIMGGVTNQGNNGLFAGLFAGGGVIPSGRYGVVGEAGPELVQGPANVSKAGNASVTYNINAVDAPSFQSLIARDPAFLYAVTEQGRSTLPSYG